MAMARHSLNHSSSGTGGGWRIAPQGKWKGGEGATVGWGICPKGIPYCVRDDPILLTRLS